MTKLPVVVKANKEELVKKVHSSDGHIVNPSAQQLHTKQSKAF